MKTSTNNLLKNIIATSALALSAISTQASELDVNFIQIDRQVGQLMVAIYDSADAFNNDGEPIQYAKVEAIGDSVTIKFEELAQGTYALKVLHDINSNGKMDLSASGLPQDGYGFSNNVGMYGVPPFDAAAFDVVDYAVIDVVVRKPVAF
jgi:uncharacterized protein (DUF2141 family)